MIHLRRGRQRRAASRSPPSASRPWSCGSPSRRAARACLPRIAGSLSMAKHPQARERRSPARPAPPSDGSSRAVGRDHGQKHREARAAARSLRLWRWSLWSSTRAMRSTMDSPRPRPRATLAPLVEPLELAETMRCFDLRDAEPGVQDIQPQPARPGAARRRGPAPDGGVLDGVRDQVLQQPPQQAPVRAHGERGRDEAQAQALLGGDRLELRAGADGASRRAGSSTIAASSPRWVEARDVEKRGEDLPPTASSEASTFSASVASARPPGRAPTSEVA